MRIVEDELAVDDIDDDGLVGVDFALEELAGHFVQYLALDDTLDGAGAHGGVVAHLGHVAIQMAIPFAPLLLKF